MPSEQKSPSASYFLKSDKGEEKGPYDLQSLQKSLEEGLIEHESLLRATDGDDWIPARQVLDVDTAPPAKRKRKKKGQKRRRNIAPVDANPYAPPGEDLSELDDVIDRTSGNWVLGFVVGLLAGPLIWALVWSRSRPRTKEGLKIGMIGALVIFVLSSLL